MEQKGGGGAGDERERDEEKENRKGPPGVSGEMSQLHVFWPCF